MSLQKIEIKFYDPTTSPANLRASNYNLRKKKRSKKITVPLDKASDKALKLYVSRIHKNIKKISTEFSNSPA